MFTEPKRSQEIAKSFLDHNQAKNLISKNCIIWVKRTGNVGGPGQQLRMETSATLIVTICGKSILQVQTLDLR